MSLSKAHIGVKPSGAASPPQNGSTYRLLLNESQSCKSWGTSQRLPPAHFKGGFAVIMFVLLMYRFIFSVTVSGKAIFVIRTKYRLSTISVVAARSRGNAMAQEVTALPSLTKSVQRLPEKLMRVRRAFDP